MDLNYAMQTKQLGHTVALVDFKTAVLKQGAKVKAAVGDVMRLALQQVDISQY